MAFFTVLCFSTRPSFLSQFHAQAGHPDDAACPAAGHWGLHAAPDDAHDAQTAPAPARAPPPAAAGTPEPAEPRRREPGSHVWGQ